jgi:hypothetical protein
MVLREKLRDTNMTRSETVTIYLTQIKQVQDELVAIEGTVDDSKLVRTTLKGLTKQWTPLIKGIVAREKLHDWTRL